MYSGKWLRWFLIEVIIDRYNGNNPLLIGIFYIGTMRERVEENLHASCTYQELSNYLAITQ